MDSIFKRNLFNEKQNNNVSELIRSIYRSLDKYESRDSTVSREFRLKRFKEKRLKRCSQAAAQDTDSESVFDKDKKSSLVWQFNQL